MKLFLSIFLAGHIISLGLAEYIRQTDNKRGWSPLQVERYAELRKDTRYQKWNTHVCLWCSRTNDCQVHHIKPVWMIVDLNLPDSMVTNQTNCATLCRKCHLWVGHKGDFENGAVTNFWPMIEQAKK